MILDELWNPQQALPLEWDGVFEPNDVYATAHDARGRSINISFTTPFGSNDIIEVEFVVNGEHEITGRGNQFQVFNTVITAITEYLRKYGRPKYFVFSSKEHSRTSLYSRLVNRFSLAQGYREISFEDFCDLEPAMCDSPGSRGTVFVLADTRPRGAQYSESQTVTEMVSDNYLYHATQPAGMMRILRSGFIKASYRPQPATQSRTQHPTVSTTRSKHYAESNDFVDFLNLDRTGNAVILVLDRDAIANRYRMFATSQGTQTVGDESEEVIVVPKGTLPLQGILKGFYFNPQRTKEIEEFKDTPWFQELLNSPYYMGAKQAMAEGWREKAAAAMTAATLGYGAMHNMMPQQEPQPVQQQQTRDPVFKDKNPLRDSLVDYAKRAGIRGTELAHFVAQMAHETANWRHMEEQPPQGARNPQRYFARKYDNRKILGNVKPGDGYRYRGRGYVQLTGRDNYTRAGRALGIDLVNNPDLAAQPDIAARIAVWFWKSRVAPRVGDFERAAVPDVTRGINPAQKGAEQRAAHFQRIANR